MNDLQIFKNKEFGSVRTAIIDGQPFFVGKDVAKILGYKDTSDALKRHIDDEDKLTRCFTDSGQNRKMYIINESGLYSLIFSSKMQNAREFKHWVTSEVLPSIRKTGGYIVNDEMFVNMYLKDADEDIRNLFLITLKALRNKNGVADAKKSIVCKQNQYMDANDKVDFINSVVKRGAHDTNTEIKRYQRLYNFLNDAYHIDLKEETKRYNKTYGKNLAQIRFAAQAGYIDELYKSCFRLYPTASNAVLEELKASY